LLADARRSGADTLLTCGGVQSNCARALAVAAAEHGLRSVLVLTGRMPDQLEGNFLLSRIVGSEIHVFEDVEPDRRDEVLAHMARWSAHRGRRPYIVPYGGSSEVGALGYVRAALEIQRQLSRREHRVAHVAVAMASGGTYAGLLIGALLLGASWRPVGAFVEGDRAGWLVRLVEYINRTCEKFRLGVRVGPDDIELIDACGAGYGVSTDPELCFIMEFARQTGIILDPVYTGRALYFLKEAIGREQFPVRGDVLLVHTGGIFGLFPYAARMQTLADAASPPALAGGVEERWPNYSGGKELREKSTKVGPAQPAAVAATGS
jgi:D-cysteine desulfhydrase